MLKRISLITLAVSLCAVTYTSEIAAAPVVARTSPVVINHLSYSPSIPKTYSNTPVKTLKTAYSIKDVPMRQTQTSNHRPIAMSAPGTTKANKDKYEYYKLENCQRHKRIGFNGWKCLDND